VAEQKRTKGVLAPSARPTAVLRSPTTLQVEGRRLLKLLRKQLPSIYRPVETVDFIFSGKKHLVFCLKSALKLQK